MAKRFRTRYDHSLEPIKAYTKGDKVVQEVRDECDINKIFDSYVATGSLPITRDLQYNGAVIDKNQYLDAYELVNKVQSDFDTLPSKVRKEFGNDVEQYLNSMSSAYSGDSIEIDRLSKLNILDKSAVTSVSPMETSPSFSSLIPRGDSQPTVETSEPVSPAE